MKPRTAISCKAAAAAAVASCAGAAASPCHASTPLAYYLQSAGPAAAPVRTLGWTLGALCAFVCVAIAVLLALAIVRRRGLSGDDGERTANTFVLAGTAVSAVLLLGAMVAMLRVLAAVADPPGTPAVALTVTACDWWWKVTYTTPSGETFDTANEIHIPTGTPVLVRLNSADVIHAFWVPALAGKTQTIPGQTNHQWIEADQPGIWRGQCTQFCGPQHAHMAFEVVAQPPGDYARWLASESRPASPPAGGDALRGAQVFAGRCAACHTIRGTEARGAQAPDLTHLQSRRLIAAGTLANTPANLSNWIAHAQQIKPESLMPDIALSPDDSRALASWLATLQ